MKRIELNQALGPVVFLGGINAMPMMYALEIKKMGIEVLYFVDRPSSDSLSRPENHFQDIKYPYPDWIVEWPLPSQILLPLFQNIFAHLIKKKIISKAKKVPQAIFLNGFFCSLSPYLFTDIPKIFLSAGSDLDSWADIDGVSILSKSFKKRSIFKFLPGKISERLIKSIVEKQFLGATKCEKVLYFPKKFNIAGDRVTEKLEAQGVDIVPRYDISFEPVKYEKRGVVSDESRLVIFSGVRFLFESFPDGNKGYNKGNDIIIRGLAEYYTLNKNIEIHFVEKGEDVLSAKKLCNLLGLDEVITWHKEMKFTELLMIYRNADVCFDQVGEHWIGAVGFYALWLGIPLIANDQRAVEAGLWDDFSPIQSAKTARQVRDRLVFLESFKTRVNVSNRSMDFAGKNLGPHSVLNEIFSFSRLY